MTDSLIEKLGALRVAEGVADFSGSGRYIRGRNDAIEEMLGIIRQHEADTKDIDKLYPPSGACSEIPMIDVEPLDLAHDVSFRDSIDIGEITPTDSQYYAIAVEAFRFFRPYLATRKPVSRLHECLDNMLHSLKAIMALSESEDDEAYGIAKKSVEWVEANHVD